MNSLIREVLANPITNVRLVRITSGSEVAEYLTLETQAERLIRAVQNRRRNTGDRGIDDYTAYPLDHLKTGTSATVSDLTSLLISFDPKVEQTEPRAAKPNPYTVYTERDQALGFVEDLLRNDLADEVMFVTISERLPEVLYYPWSKSAPIINCVPTRTVWRSKEAPPGLTAMQHAFQVETPLTDPVG